MNGYNYNIIFNGYWIESYISEIPHVSGVYLVYRCVHNRQKNVVELKELLYIGQAQDLNKRLCNYDKKKKALFQSSCKEGETLCYSFAEVAINDLDVVENALIFAQQPILNTDLKDSFNHPTPKSFLIEGKCSLLRFYDFSIK